MLIRCIALKIWRFEFFSRFSWNAYSRPQNFGFWGSEPLNVIGHHRNPQKAHPRLEPRSHGDFGADRSSGATWVRDEGTKKGKERNSQWQTGCSPRPPTLTQRYVVLHAGWSSGDSFKFQVSSKSDEPFSRCGGRNLPFPILKASGLYSSLYYRTSRGLYYRTSRDSSDMNDYRFVFNCIIIW